MQLVGNSNLVKLSIWIYFSEEYHYTLRLIRWLNMFNLRLGLSFILIALYTLCMLVLLYKPGQRIYNYSHTSSTHRFIWNSSYILYANNLHPLSSYADRILLMYIYIYVCVCVCVWRSTKLIRQIEYNFYAVNVLGGFQLVSTLGHCQGKTFYGEKRKLLFWRGKC